MASAHCDGNDVNQAVAKNPICSENFSVPVVSPAIAAHPAAGKRLNLWGSNFAEVASWTRDMNPKSIKKSIGNRLQLRISG